jgi:hypothetical protein
MIKYEVITDWNYKDSAINADFTRDIYHYSFRDIIAQEHYTIDTIRHNDFLSKLYADWGKSYFEDLREERKQKHETAVAKKAEAEAELVNIRKEIKKYISFIMENY